MKKRCAVKIECFEELLDQYGWDLASWPEALRREANVLIAQDAHAAELLSSLRNVEDILADDLVPMGKHQAVDDIFAAIEAEETRIAATDQVSAQDPNNHFKSIDDRPRLRAHLTAAHSAPVPDGPTRRTYPAKSSVSPVNSAIVSDGAQFNGRAKGILRLLGKGVFSGVGMVVCVVAGFFFGVTMTAQQGHQVNAHATEAGMVDLLQNHVYATDSLGPDQTVQHSKNVGNVHKQGEQSQ